MTNRNIVVIGASAGGFQALKNLVAQLPAGFPAAVLIVWHVLPDRPSVLPDVLQKVSELPVKHAANGERFQSGNIYVALPDHHLLLLENDRIGITQGPKENRRETARLIL